jgi:hypothetical protein
LKLSFNKSGQNCHQRPKKRSARLKSPDKKGRPVMATVTSQSLSPTAGSREGSNPFAEIRAFWRQFFARAFNPYRPELHYMRGPGPAWRAKHVASSHRLSS